MNDTPPAPPTLELERVSVLLSRARPTPALAKPRDLPDLARFLWSSLGQGAAENVSALAGVDVRADAGCLAILGEEGAGKSTLVMLLARVLKPSEGAVRLGGVDIHGARGRELLDVRRRLQIVLDDEGGALDPRLPLSRSFALFASALRLPPPQRDAMIEVLRRVHLDERALDEPARALGRGEAKRAAIARALLAAPSVVVLDEPSHGLDPTERMAVLSAIARLVSHALIVVATRDVALARAVATRVAVLSHGELIECDEADRVFFAPGHDVTRALVASAPTARQGASGSS